MNLLLLDQYSDPGGAQHCLLDLLPAFSQRRWRSVVAAPGDGALFERARAAGALVERLSFETYPAGGKSVGDIVRFARSFRRTARQIRELLARHRIHLLYVNGPRLVPAAVWAAGRSIPIVFHCHSSVPKPYGALLVGGPLAWAGATVISSSKFTAESIRPNTPTHIIYNGVPDCGRPKTASGGGYRIGIIGRISQQKGQMLFVEAARLLADTLPGCSFEICGEPLFGDPESIRYEEQVRQLARGLPIRFSGWTDDIAAVLARLDLLVVPSIAAEATTRVILEAFSAEVPVVALATGGIPEVISHGRTGFLVSEPGPHALAGSITAAFEIRTSLVNAARNEWEDRFTLDRYQRDVVDLLDRATAGFKAPEKGTKYQGRENRDSGDRGEDDRIAKA